MKYVFATITLISVTACSSSGVLPMGSGVYTVTTDTFSPATSKKSAFEDAMNFCSKSGKSIKVVSSQEMSNNRWNLDFRCE